MAALLWLPWLMLLAGVQQSSEIKDNNRNKNPRQDSDADRLITGPLLRKPLIPELSQRETHALLNSVPQIDHIVVFYVPLNSICRQFMNLFMALSRQFKTEQKSVKFAKVNCYGSFYGENLCQKYNIHAVPTVVYVSSLPLQPGALPADSFIRRGFLWCISRFVEDIHSPHATRYVTSLLRHPPQLQGRRFHLRRAQGLGHNHVPLVPNQAQFEQNKVAFHLWTDKETSNAIIDIALPGYQYIARASPPPLRTPM